eukprot:3233388-Pyramimonas_sp.AAC.1
MLAPTRVLIADGNAWATGDDIDDIGRPPPMADISANRDDGEVVDYLGRWLRVRGQAGHRRCQCHARWSKPGAALAADERRRQPERRRASASLWPPFVRVY